jgi:hypothetical protein
MCVELSKTKKIFSKNCPHLDRHLNEASTNINLDCYPYTSLIGLTASGNVVELVPDYTASPLFVVTTVKTSNQCTSHTLVTGPPVKSTKSM